MSDRFINTGAASRMLGYSSEYIRQFTDSGRIPVERTANGQRIFWEADILRFQEERNSKTARAANNHP